MSLSNQAKELANQVIHSQKPLTFKVNATRDIVERLVLEINKFKVNAQLVSIEGNVGVYIEPTFKKVKKEKITEIDVQSLIPETLELDTPDSSSIQKVIWNEKSLIVHYKSNPAIPYAYPNVPREEFDKIKDVYQTGNSVGSYISQKIKKVYSVAKLA